MGGCWWAKKPQYIHTMEKYSAIKGTNYSYKNNLNQLKDIVLREKAYFKKLHTVV